MGFLHVRIQIEAVSRIRVWLSGLVYVKSKRGCDVISYCAVGTGTGHETTVELKLPSGSSNDWKNKQTKRIDLLKCNDSIIVFT